MKIGQKKSVFTKPAGQSPPDDHARLAGLLLGLITILLYLPAGFHDFIFFDDPSYVTDNDMVKNGLTWAGFKWAFVGWHASNWHPLTWLSHELDCELFGLNAGAHHLVNVLFHAATTVLLFLLWLRLTKACWPSALVAALFAWHPLHVESVAWVSERKDVLSTFFGLLSLLAYTRYAEGFAGQSNSSSDKAGGPKTFYALSLLAFALGLLAKPMLVTLPFLLLLLDYWPLRRFAEGGRYLSQGARLLAEKWPFFLLTAGSCLFTLLAQRQTAVVSLQQYPVGLRVENAMVACGAYVAKIFWPVHLSIFYPLPRHFSLLQLLVSAAMLAGVSALAWHWRWRHRYLLFGWLWFLGMLVPVIGLIQVGDQAMADRYTYLSAVGIFVALAFGLAEAQARWKIPARQLAVAAVLLLGTCLALTEHQLAYWRDSETLFTHALAVAKNNGPAKMMLGIAYEKRGETDKARQEYKDALADDDSLIVQVAGGEKRSFAAQVQLMFGQSAEEKGQLPEAIAHYREALRLDPDIVEAHNNLGNLLVESGQSGAALLEYQAAVRLRPEAPLVRENLGTQLVQGGRFDEGMREYQEAARLAPKDSQPLYLMGKAWLRHGDGPAAVLAFQNALRLNPRDYQSLVWLARLLASDPAPQIRDGGAAVTLAEQANDLTGGNQPFVLETLAMAYAEAGRYDEARKTARVALDLATGAGGKTATDLRNQLQRYEANQPWRDSFTNPAAK